MLTYSAAQRGGPRPAHFMQRRQSRGRPGNTKCLINSLICCDCRAWKACFPAIWCQENPAQCCSQTHVHARRFLLPTIWPTFMCGGGNKDRITLDYFHESTTRGQASYWPLTRQTWTDRKLKTAKVKKQDGATLGNKGGGNRWTQEWVFSGKQTSKPQISLTAFSTLGCEKLTFLFSFVLFKNM